MKITVNGFNVEILGEYIECDSYGQMLGYVTEQMIECIEGAEDQADAIHFLYKHTPQHVFINKINKFLHEKRVFEYDFRASLDAEFIDR